MTKRTKDTTQGDGAANALEAFVKKELGIELLPAQRDFVAARERFVAFVGGVGSGKTVAGAVKTLYYAHHHAGALGLVGAPNRTMLRDVTIRSLLELLPEQWVRERRLSEGAITLRNGSEILLRSLDDWEHRRGLNLGFAWLDEGILCGYGAWRMLKARLRQAAMEQQAWITSTPRGQDEFYRDFEVRRDERHRLIRAATRDNPYLPEGYAESLGYAGSFALQELEGRFVTREGLVYRLRAEHLAPAPAVAACHDVFGGVDWGFRNPFQASVFGAVGQGFHLLREFRATEASLDGVIIPALARLTRELGVRRWYADPSRPDMIAALGAGLRAAGERCQVVPAVNAILDGLDSVRSLLDATPPRLLIDPACVHTLSEMGEYAFPEAATGTEQPVKANDHAMDAMRYALHTRQREWRPGGAASLAALAARMKREGLS